MRAAAVQLNSTEDKDRNLEVAVRLMRDAAESGAELVVLPEKFNVIGTEQHLRAGAEPLDGPTLRIMSGLARELGVWLVAGSIVERVDGEREAAKHLGRCSARTASITPSIARSTCSTSRWAASVYRESDTEAPGDEIVIADVDGLPLGLTICYDLRFPELFRILAVRGARAVALPAAFTLHTGKDHWEVLVRARAIENQVFMIAAGQIGVHPPGHESYGRSMIVDPWGSDARRRARQRVLRDRRSRPRRPGSHPRSAALARKPPTRGLRLARSGAGGRKPMTVRMPTR